MGLQRKIYEASAANDSAAGKPDFSRRTAEVSSEEYFP